MQSLCALSLRFEMTFLFFLAFLISALAGFSFLFSSLTDEISAKVVRWKEGEIRGGSSTQRIGW